MNRTEYETMLDALMQNIEKENGNFGACDERPALSPAQRRTVAGIALMAVDQYHQHLSKRLAALEEL
ncbi:MAG: hypothetical protein LBU67_03085 [Oscillospiraceae bacterium]|jgi:hypothetical protein|nr:hypothetical protein [Oscillospiraceae bacterium]